jgi:hypothetical protein
MNSFLRDSIEQDLRGVRIKLLKFNVPKLWSGVTFFLQGPLAEERAWILVRGGLN